MRENANVKPVDVCLLLEGTYPYVKGGVSTWVHQIVAAMPDLDFAIFFLGQDSATAGEKKYDIPPQVRRMESVFLFETPPPAPREARRNGRAVELDPAITRACRRFLECDALERREGRLPVEVSAPFLDDLCDLSRRHSFEAFWNSRPVWETFCQFYRMRLAEESFVDAFWNARFLIEPLWKTLQAMDRLPPARVYHSVSTGYAGILGAAASRQCGTPFLLSEHGIYVRERYTDLLCSAWKPSLNPHARMNVHGVSVLRQLWINLFVHLGKIAYATAPRIVSLFQRNADLQVEFGADPARIDIIPNGVDLSRFESVRKARREQRSAEPGRMTVGFLGRVVPIKDVRTLIRAARVTCEALPRARFLIVGPTDEDEVYAQECRQAIEELNLNDRVEMPGSQQVGEALPSFDVMVLSSVSEGLPYCILEAFAADIPVVATDVGSCSELILGHPKEDPTLGPAGRVVRAGDAAGLGQALVELLRDRDLQDRLGRAGRKRTAASYDEKHVIRAYRTLYVQLPGPVPGEPEEEEA